MSSFHIENFGCRAARADGEAVAARLRAEGMAQSSHAAAEVVVVNTCSVTAEADRDARAFVRKTRRLNPKAQVVVTGCYAQRAPEELAALEGVAAVVGNSHKGLLPEIVRSLVSAQTQAVALGPPNESSPTLIPIAGLLAPTALPQLWVDDRFAHSFIEEAQVAPGSGPDSQTRPNLKIQEGCNNRCTFCVIPTTRGSSRSMASAAVMSQVRGFIAAGGKELVLSGINLGRWGWDIPRNSTAARFSELVRAILETTDLPRVRLSSIEPMDWTPDLIALLRDFGPSGRLARHAHLPLQSGSDAVLRRMHRRYRPWHYTAKIESLVLAAGPELAIGADVMIGFPGETEVEFRETHALIAGLPFTYLHLFPFSPRPGTPGWELHRQSPVAPAAVRERMAALHYLANEKNRSFRTRMLGRTLPAITLHTSPSLRSHGRSSALTDNYIPIELNQLFPSNQCIDVRLTSVDASGVVSGTANSSPGNTAVAV